MNILIIGANGFVGKHLVSHHLLQEDKVTSVYHKRTDFLHKQSKQVNIENIHSIKGEADIVYILSSYIPYTDMNQSSVDMIETNIDLVKRVCDQFHNSKIIFASSVSVYGNHNNNIITETSCYNNPNLYGQSKLAGEFIVKNYSNYSILRFSSIYGAGMNKSTFLPKIINGALVEHKIDIWGTGSRKQNYIHVDDAVSYLVSAAMYKGNETFLGVYEKSYSNLEIAQLIQKQLPGTEITFMGSDNSPSWIYNNVRTNTLLNFKPLIPPEEGIRTLINDN
jgi:UDP-glucose 4-epimerase